VRLAEGFLCFKANAFGENSGFDENIVFSDHGLCPLRLVVRKPCLKRLNGLYEVVFVFCKYKITALLCQGKCRRTMFQGVSGCMLL
jgi:hypothetical protein